MLLLIIMSFSLFAGEVSDTNKDYKTIRIAVENVSKIRIKFSKLHFVTCQESKFRTQVFDYELGKKLDGHSHYEGELYRSYGTFLVLADVYKLNRSGCMPDVNPTWKLFKGNVEYFFKANNYRKVSISLIIPFGVDVDVKKYL